ncbi:oxygen-independent coproporphyrinogen III oxidase [Neogemmobacter tilapiae]|uniref:Coproporphyrinogen-III oxidase n=1 Tax=Neogemmobacter tilapiae TaxID=875041 RepID=A0A918WKZ6_9RHOB|nr:oxygen-independent coproporphyrinogen III oxidase [Gemmobacter tilapiae]GHC61211.1 coproporphyrinogen-III oxidase [Gemmobacter tilapiae]
MPLDAATVQRHASQPVPRYTSYPTAPHFNTDVGPELYRRWLGELPDQAKLSLYLHVPFCDSLCWFCGCQTKITRQYAPIRSYLDSLMAEIALVASLIPAKARVHHIHWGGGSPTILTAQDSAALMNHLRDHFTLEETDFAVEVDPRGMDNDRIDALCAAGLTRVSLGVQDFDPKVQKAINRVQSFAETKAVIDRFRANGVRSLNIDAVYGLPHQGWAELSATLDQVLALSPDRIALFGYAHVPWMKPHQRLIPEEALAGPVERHDHAERAAELLMAAGYLRVGIDHFARPGDELALAAQENRVQRNFQGYTVDPADALIGLGASSIGRLPQGYVQNDAAMGRYGRAVQAGRLATVKGRALTDQDRLRGHVIERLMCDLAFDGAALTAHFGEAAAAMRQIAAQIIADDMDGFVLETPQGFTVTPAGRPFLRTLAARFDAYLQPRKGQHSLAV